MNYKKRGSETTVKDVVLRNLKVSSTDELNDWFKKSYSGGYWIKFLLEAIKLALQFIYKKVTIVGDYDADGVDATAILYLALTWFGFKNVSYIIPTRKQGFGISCEIIDQIDEGLIITCDNGIAGIEPIKKAKEKGLTVIVLDHHEPVRDKKTKEIILPPADIIIDPKIPGSCEFDGYCGAGLAYRFAAELLKDYKGLVQKLQPFAAIGTICDVMDLVEENYVIAKNGMKRMEDVRFCTTGLYALLSSCNVNNNITGHNIGFKPGPCINAASRILDDASISVELLIYDGPYPVAAKMAERLIEINEQRKKEKIEGLRYAEEIIEKNNLYGECPLILYIPGIKEGIVGIISGNLTEKYNVPSIVFTDTDNPEHLKASARSCEEWNMHENLCKVESLMVKFGGHPGAAGLTIERNKFNAFKQTLINVSDELVSTKDPNIIEFDLEVNAKDVPSYVEELKRFEPFGKANPEIIFKVKDFNVLPRYGQFKHYIGERANIVKLYSKNVTAIGFDMAKLLEQYDSPKKCDFIGTLSCNCFNGNVEYQIEFADVIVHKIEHSTTDMVKSLKTLALNRISNNS